MSSRAILPVTAVSADADIDGLSAPATRVRSYWRSVLVRLGRDRLTLVFGAAVLAIVVVAIAAPLVAPFDPYQQSIIGRLKPFGSTRSIRSAST